MDRVYFSAGALLWAVSLILSCFGNQHFLCGFCMALGVCLLLCGRGRPGWLLAMKNRLFRRAR